MKYLIIYAHPNPKSFNNGIREAVEENLRKADKDFVVRDLYNLKFNPVLAGPDFMAFKDGKVPADIAQEQDYIRKAETLIFIYPIWWFSMPAVLKGYIDRVFSYGFAYAVNENGPYGLLTGKNAVILNTTGGPEENYQKFGFAAALKTTTEAGVFEFCGMKISAHKFFHAVPYISQEARGKMLEEIRTFKF